MAIMYWNFSTSKWASSSPGFTDSPKLAYWKDPDNQVTYLDNSTNAVYVSYLLKWDTAKSVLTLEFKIRARNYNMTSSLTGYLGKSTLPKFTGTFGFILRVDNTAVFNMPNIQDVNSATVAASITNKMPRLAQASSLQYNTASVDGSTVKVPWSVDVTNYAGGSLKANIRLAWSRIYTSGGARMLQQLDMVSKGNTSCGTLPSIYTVSYDANGHGTAPASQKKVDGLSITLASTLPSVTEDGTIESVVITGDANGGEWDGENGYATYEHERTTYSSSQWNTSADGSGTSYGSQYPYSTNADATMYAIWKATVASDIAKSYVVPSGTPFIPSYDEQCTVVYDPNGGITDRESDTARAIVSYTFLGWYTSPTGGYQRNSSSRVTKAETVYAHYREVRTGTSKFVPNAEECRRKNYTLLGWSKDPNDTTPQYPIGSMCPITQNETLYAIWKKDTTMVPKVFVDGAWVEAAPHVYSNGSWVKAKPNLYIDGEWKSYED